MRLPLRAGVVIGLAAVAACGKDAPTPVDFTDPAAVSANLSSVDSAFDSDVFKSFGNASTMLDIATSPALRPVASLLETTRPELKRSGAHIFLPNLLQAQRLQAAVPNLSVAAAQGRIIPDSMYGRVFEWDATLHQYSYQGTTVANLNGVRFILYAIGLDGAVVEPVSAIGTLDIIDESTPQQLKLHVLVKGPGGTTTYVDYLATVVTSTNSANATASASGFISNGLGGSANKTLSFDESLSVNTAGARITATFALNNPAITLMMNETFSFNDPNIVLDADFRLIQNGETIRTVGHITINTVTNVTSISVTVYLNGHPVASIDGDPSDPGTEWVDAGGEPLTIADLAALDHLFDAWSSFQQAVSGLLAPISTFGGA